MFGFSLRKQIVDAYKRHEHLKDYTDEELAVELNSLERLPVEILAGICGEILRRQQEGNKTIKQ